MFTLWSSCSVYFWYMVFLFTVLLGEILVLAMVDVLAVDQKALLDQKTLFQELDLLNHSGTWADYQSSKSTSTKNIQQQHQDRWWVSVIFLNKILFFVCLTNCTYDTVQLGVIIVLFFWLQLRVLDISWYLQRLAYLVISSEYILME